MRIGVALAVFAAQAYQAQAAASYTEMSNCRRPTTEVPQFDDAPLNQVPTLDANGVQVTVEQDAPCSEPQTGLQWEWLSNDSRTNLQELYVQSTNSAGVADYQWREINKNKWTGDITLTKRLTYSSLYFARPITDYDGCYNRVPSTPATTVQGYWDYQTIIDSGENDIKANIAQMCKQDECELENIKEYYRIAPNEQNVVPPATTAKVPDVIPTWSTYLLSVDEYKLEAKARAGAASAVAAEVLKTGTEWT